MSFEILMPALSPTMTHGHVVKWHKKPQDPVEIGDLILEVETDKAIMEVEAVDAGTLGPHYVIEGTQDVKVGTCLAMIYEEGEEISETSADVVATDVPNSADQASQEESLEKDASSLSSHGITMSLESELRRVHASPLARRLAKDRGIDLQTLEGTGPRGRIVARDVPDRASAPVDAPVTTTVFSGHEPPYKRESLPSMRKIIAQRLTESKQTIPHFYLRRQCRMDRLMEARAAWNEQAKTRISVTDVVIKACARALDKHPSMRCVWDGDGVRYYDYAHIAVAVALDKGLITPVLKNPASWPLEKLSEHTKDLFARAREQKLKPDELQGGIFSLSNLGPYGIEDFDAIIPPSQSAILAMGATKPVAYPHDHEGVQWIPTMTLSLSVDHRVIDGAVGAEFMGTLVELLENPLLLVL